MRAKRCPYCQRLLTLNPRVRKRRKTCGRPSCQKSLKRENSARWRKEHPDNCPLDYPCVKLWLPKPPGYLQHYRETHPGYVEKNRQAQRLRDRRKNLPLDIQNKIKRQPTEIIDQRNGGRNVGRSGKFALYIFGREVARDLRCALRLSSRLFEKCIKGT
jgi:hypothetical protein